ncbi:O-antigen ligase family protein [candidate division WWE3 bacterium]|nr:O-antigen ligase family protein [candidate division WWE3 bacterium]
MFKNVSTKAIFTLFKLLVFFTPTIFVANTHELFEFPKMYFVYAVGTTIIWLFLIKKISLEEKLLWPSKSVILFLLVYILSTLLSSHQQTSVWGYYTRFNGGLMSVLVFVGLYWVAINEYTKKQLKELVKIACFSIIPIGIYAISQHYGFIANIWKSNSVERAFSTFGQPNWLAAYSVMIIPIILGQLLLNKNENKRLWVLLYVLAFSSLWFSQSISGILAFLIIIPIFITINWNKLKKKRRLFATLILASILLTIVEPGIFKGKINDAFFDVKTMLKVQAQEIAIPTDSHSISDPGFIRQYLWRGTLNLIFSSPKNTILGTGPETYPYEFQRFRPEELNDSSEWNFVFNKPHNYYLELWANLGILGLVSYLLLIKKILKKPDPFYSLALVSFLIVNFFGWPTVSTSLLFWMFLAGRDAAE